MLMVVGECPLRGDVIRGTRLIWGANRLTDRTRLEEWGFKPREVMDIAIQGEGT